MTEAEKWLNASNIEKQTGPSQCGQTPAGKYLNETRNEASSTRNNSESAEGKKPEVSMIMRMIGIIACIILFFAGVYFHGVSKRPNMFLAFTFAAAGFGTLGVFWNVRKGS